MPPTTEQPPQPAAQTETPVIEQPNGPQAYPTPSIQSLDSDPNHAMAMLIAKRKEGKAAEKPEAPTSKAKEPEKAKEADAESPRLNDLISGVLAGSRKKAVKAEKEEKKEEKKEEAATVEVKNEEEKAEEPESKAAKSIVTKKKQAPVVDTTKMVSEAAASAATAAVKALQQPEKKEAAPVAGPEDTLKGQDRRDYLNAKLLSDTNPKFKGAEGVILDQIKRAEKYANRWESANPGKEFDPDEDEHKEFFDALDAEKTWSDQDIEEAKGIQIEKKIEEKLSRANQEKFKKLEEDSARIELTPTVDGAFSAAAGTLLKAIGGEVQEIVNKEGFGKLEEKDPITAAVLAETLGPLKPIIETIYQLDDPKGRFAIDPKNPLHQQWHEILTEGEARCEGVVDDSGKKFATRIEYQRMNPTQRAKHWFLTPEHLVAGIVDYASKTASEYIKKEKDRQIKIAESLGFVPKAQQPARTETTKQEKVEGPAKPAPSVIKPVSPTVGSGAKIDDSGDKQKSEKAVLMDIMTKTLFKRT